MLDLFPQTSIRIKSLLICSHIQAIPKIILRHQSCNVKACGVCGIAEEEITSLYK